MNNKKQSIQLISILLTFMVINPVLAVTHTTKYDYDFVASTITKTDPGPDKRQTKYTFDAIKQLIRIDLLNMPDTQKTYQYRYDKRNALKEIEYPFQGTQKTATFVKDNLGYIKSLTEFGQTNLVQYKYDYFGRLKWLVYPKDSNDKSRSVCYSYNANNTIAKLSMYEAVSIPATPRDNCPSTGARDIRYAYQEKVENGNTYQNSKPTDIYYPNGKHKHIEYYSGNGLVSSISLRNNDDSEFYTESYAYVENAALVESVTVSGSNLNTKKTSYTYDAFQRLDTITEADGRFTDYEYDLFGNRTWEKISNTNDANATSGWPKVYGDYEYVYEAGSNRLKEIKLNGTLLESFGYDDVGRITSRSHSTNGYTAYAYNDLGKLITIEKGLNETSITTTITYEYDALGTRKSKTVSAGGNTETTYYVTSNLFGFSHVLAELAPDLSIKKSYTYLDNQPVYEELDTNDRNKDLFLFTAGLTNNITHALNTSGTITNINSYSAFGSANPVVSQSNGSSMHYGYTSEETEAESGLIYLRARYYDPMLGRFISDDPYQGRIEEPVTQNPYIYVHNNPITNIDPSGLVVPIVTACAANPVCRAGAEKVGTAAVSGVTTGYLSYSEGKDLFDVAKDAGVAFLASLAIPGVGNIATKGATAGVVGNSAAQGLDIAIGSRENFSVPQMVSAGVASAGASWTGLASGFVSGYKVIGVATAEFTGQALSQVGSTIEEQWDWTPTQCR